MRGIDAGDRLKYCRKVLKISQKEMADNKVSSNLISLIERGRVPLSTVTASLLIDNLNRLSLEKKMKMNLSLKDLVGSYEDYILKMCWGSIGVDNDSKYISEVYQRFLVVAKEIDKVKSMLDIEKYFGKIFFDKREYSRAERHFERYLELSNDSDMEIMEDISDVYYYLSICKHKNNDVTNGIKYGEMSYKIIRKNNLKKTYLRELKNIASESIVDYKEEISNMFIAELNNGSGVRSESVKKMIGIIYDYAENGECVEILNLLDQLKRKIV